MLKIFLSVSMVLFPVLVMSEPSGNSIIYWTDLGFIEQARLILGSVLIVAFGRVGIAVFTNIWIKNGYSGADGILVDREVSLYVFHVLAYCAFIFFCFLALFQKYSGTPMFVYYIDAMVFLSPEAINVLHRVMDKFTSKKKE